MSIKRPSRTEYDKAIEEIEKLQHWLTLEERRRDKLLDELLSSRETILMYEESLAANKEIKMIYELYQETEHEKTLTQLKKQTQ